MTIKTFSIEYDAINSKNTFTNGDVINGRIIVEASKTTVISSLVFKAQGRAWVSWSEHYGPHHDQTYWQKEKYYDVKHHMLRETRRDGTGVIGKGRHVFPFSFTIPDRKIPSSFKSFMGEIFHKLKAELKQSMKLTKKAKVRFMFVSKPDMDILGLMEPQYGCKTKSVLFGSGNVSMDVHTTRMAYKQGEDVKVRVDVINRSSRSVKPKFVLYEKKSFFAQGRRRVYNNDILKENTDECSGKKTVTKVIRLPGDLPPSILNCSIIKLEYRLKIYLDVKCASDPEVILPIVVLPTSEVPAMKQPPASDGIGHEAFGSPSQTQWSMTPQHQAAFQPMDPPPPYGAHAMYPPAFDSEKNQTAL